MIDVPLHEQTLARLLHMQAQRHPERPFLWYGGRKFSYAQAFERSARIAAGMSAAGIGPKQHVAIMMENRPEVIWINFALAMLGAVSIPVNTALRGDMLAQTIRQSDSTAIFIDPSLVERFAAVRSACSLVTRVAVVPIGDAEDQPLLLDAAEQMSWARIVETPASEDVSKAAYNDTLHIVFSSGTTGPAKGSVATNASAIMSARKHVESLQLESTDILYTCLPMFHGNAWNCTILPALTAGASVALSRRFSASGFWREIRESNATHASLLGAMVNFLWLQNPSDDERNHRLRTCLVVPVPPFALEFEKRFNTRVASLYALSDFGLATMLAPDAPREKIRSAGRPIPEVTVAILDEHDQPVAPGQTGQICLRSNQAWFSRQGYYKMPELWAHVVRNLWLHTGDMGWIDADGYLYFAGRDKDLIRRRGENISAVQVEDVLRRHPRVADAAVYAVRAEFLEDEVMASVVCRDGDQVDHADLIDFCAPQMAYFMVPRFLEILPELPLTPTGKVEKYKLREAAERHLAEVWDREKSGIVLEK